MNTVIEATNQLSDKSDRWLFIGVLVLLVFGAVMAIRYLVNKNDEAWKQNQQRSDTYAASLKEIADNQIEANKSLAVVLDRNTQASNATREALEGCAAELRLCRESRT